MQTTKNNFYKELFQFDFDEMKHFKNYFIYNNYENVIKNVLK